MTEVPKFECIVDISYKIGYVLVNNTMQIEKEGK